MEQSPTDTSKMSGGIKNKKGNNSFNSIAYISFKWSFESVNIIDATVISM